MAAGLGFKNFSSGEVLTAADVNGYLNSQTVMVFASAAARSAAITSPQEGMISFLKDTDATQFYTGAAWANLDTTGMTNPMTTTGDVIYSSSGTTPARLGIGTAGQVLQVNSGATAPEWATAATPPSSGMTFISRTTFSSVASVTLDNIFTSTYENYFVRIVSDGGTSVLKMQARVSGVTITSSNYTTAVRMVDAFGNPSNFSFNNQADFRINASTTSPDKSLTDLTFFRQSSSTRLRYTTTLFDDSNLRGGAGGGVLIRDEIYTGLHFFPTTGNMTGIVTVYGLASA